MLQMKVPQIALFRELAHDVAWGFTFCFLPQIEVSSARSRESLDTSCSSVAAGSCHTGGPFLFLTGEAEGSLGGTKGKRSSSSVAGSRFFSGRFLP